ncbi:hypothetical protein E2C01_078809 [Portunus trituberculatus]|uniref:Uncharacterized protein n=1 Tax=Portunus trituberculatus TaxID=210409 RepID=A0A5B7IV43_PORTR|nr:hypothetical protein [Portunus trituberculatus]
MYWMLCFCGR